MRWLAFILLLPVLCFAQEVAFADGFENGGCMTRWNMGIKVAPPVGGSDLKMRANISLPVRKGHAISGALIGQGGTPPYAFSEVTSTLSAIGVTIHSDGTITGTPTAQGHVTFLAQIQDAALGVFKCIFSIDVLPPIYVVAATPPTGEVSVTYDYNVKVAGYLGTAEDLRWTTTGSLPGGMELRGQGKTAWGPNTTTSGAITVVGGTYRVPLTADPGYVDGEWIEVNDFVNNWVQGRIESGGGTNVVFLTIATARSMGTVTSIAAGTIVYTSNGGELNGIPTTAGSYHFTTRVTDTTTGDYLDIPLAVEIVDTPVISFDNTTSPGPGGVAGTYLPPAYIGVPYSATVTVTNGLAPFRFAQNGTTVTDVTGLSVDPTTGVVSGTITDTSLAIGYGGSPFLLEVGVTDALGGTAVVAQAALMVQQFTPDTDVTMASNSNELVPTQAAVVAYVAANAGVGSSITDDNSTTQIDSAGVISVLAAPKLLTARSISMTGDVAWTVSFDGSGNVTAAGTVVSASTTQAGKLSANDYGELQALAHAALGGM